MKKDQHFDFKILIKVLKLNATKPSKTDRRLTDLQEKTR